MAGKKHTYIHHEGPLVDGLILGRLTILRKGDRLSPRGGKQPSQYFWCECECGIVKQVAYAALKNGYARSCGCHRVANTREMKLKHGATVNRFHSPEYKAWRHAKSRCYNPNDPRFSRYGARGISMCDEWLNDFQAFIEHVGLRPSPKHSLDRKDNNKNYEPGNMRWATAVEQGANREYVILARARKGLLAQEREAD